ncbi:hypothetical protein FHU33_1367 [Blastococcus colisei]|uniref:Uncharacterized protein n=1 Tax=Blastococcus colisei TaxID=1564162 RepID=A0A543PD20_9ACTN|nr:hypothetical protein [Blastococcus colisei]TQN41978.1 hypothetical protein FHU33_1367 [Blastococcus colisei]
MADEPSTFARLERVASSAASVVAPLSVISALLFYFGYASSRAQYEYFGVDVDTIGLSTQDYVMRSPGPLLTPLLALLLLAVAVAALNELIRRRVAAAFADGKDPAPAVRDRSRRRLRRDRQLARAVVGAGYAVLLAGVALILAYGSLLNWPYYPLVTPLTLALGAALVLYGRRIDRLLDPRGAGRRPMAMSLVLVLGVSVFWATATFAQWSGRGSAEELALTIDRLPSVILDTTEPLHLTARNVAEEVLPPSEGQTYRYRYRNLRLLIQGRDRLFLVPGGQWSAEHSTLVVPMDGDVRLQFQFQNDPPFEVEPP